MSILAKKAILCSLLNCTVVCKVVCNFCIIIITKIIINMVQRKSVLQPAILASCSWHVPAHKSFQLVPKPYLISRIDYNPSVI